MRNAKFSVSELFMHLACISDGLNHRTGSEVCLRMEPINIGCRLATNHLRFRRPAERQYSTQRERTNGQPRVLRKSERAASNWEDRDRSLTATNSVNDAGDLQA